MSVNAIRILVLVLSFGAFLSCLVWAYGPSRRSRFEGLGRSILSEGEDQAEAGR
jgi:cbb3-type cytochrome oxidase subunit 3